MFVDHPSASIGLDGEDASLQFGVGNLPDALLEGFQEAVGQALEG